MTEAHVCSALLLSEIVLYFIEDYSACCCEVHVWRESSKTVITMEFMSF